MAQAKAQTEPEPLAWKGKPLAEVVREDFEKARAALGTEITRILTEANLARVSNLRGWTMKNSVGRGMIVGYSVPVGAKQPSMADLAPHRKALKAAGLRVKVHPDDTALLVFAPPPDY